MRQPLVSPAQSNTRWSTGFVSESFESGGRFRALAMIDDYTRECLALEADTSLSVTRVVQVLKRLAEP